MIKLTLIRHATPELDSISGRDFDRQLNDIGIQQATGLSKYLYETNPKVQTVLCSAAKRTQQTFDVFKNSIKNYHLEILDDLYQTETDKILKLLSIYNLSTSIMIIGHNPWISDLIDYLCEEKVNMSPCDMVQIEVDVDFFSDLSRGLGRIINHVSF